MSYNFVFDEYKNKSVISCNNNVIHNQSKISYIFLDSVVFDRLVYFYFFFF